MRNKYNSKRAKNVMQPLMRFDDLSRRSFRMLNPPWLLQTACTLKMVIVTSRSGYLTRTHGTWIASESLGLGQVIPQVACQLQWKKFQSPSGLRRYIIHQRQNASKCSVKLLQGKACVTTQIATILNMTKWAACPGKIDWSIHDVCTVTWTSLHL